jgi:hypothetical protein
MYLLNCSGISPQQRTIIIVTNAPVDEWIVRWNVLKKQYKYVEGVAVKIMKLSILCYNSICLMCSRQWHISSPLPLSYPEKKIGEPKDEIGNLNGFEYMYLSDLKVPFPWAQH